MNSYTMALREQMDQGRLAQQSTSYGTLFTSFGAVVRNNTYANIYKMWYGCGDHFFAEIQQHLPGVSQAKKEPAQWPQCLFYFMRKLYEARADLIAKGGFSRDVLNTFGQSGRVIVAAKANQYRVTYVIPSSSVLPLNLQRDGGSKYFSW